MGPTSGSDGRSGGRADRRPTGAGGRRAPAAEWSGMGERRLAGSIRIFSGNLCWGRASSEALVELIRKHRVDVFAAQELGFENAEAISSELPHGLLEPHEGFMGMGIASRAPVETSRIPLPHRDARRAQLAPSDWPGLEQPVCLVNVHFQAPHAMRPFPSLWLRRRQAQAFEAFLLANPSEARCVVGDYNATPAWPLYRRMRRHLEDAAVHAARREGRPVRPTWGPRAESRRLLRIDHALVRGLEIQSFQVVDLPGSDHSGILLECAPRPARVGALDVVTPEAVDGVAEAALAAAESEIEAADAAALAAGTAAGPADAARAAAAAATVARATATAVATAKATVERAPAA